MPPGWVPLLLSAGIDAILWSSLGPANAPDPQIMNYAAQNGYAIITRDLDFGGHLAIGGFLLPSVIQVRCDDVSTTIIGDHVIDAIQQNTSVLITGALVTVELWTRPRVKINLLPITRRELTVR